MSETNYNHLHRTGDGVISSTDAQITVGDIRDAIASYPDDAEVVLSVCDHGDAQRIFGFKSRGKDVLQFLVCSE